MMTDQLNFPNWYQRIFQVVKNCLSYSKCLGTSFFQDRHTRCVPTQDNDPPEWRPRHQGFLVSGIPNMAALCRCPHDEIGHKDASSSFVTIRQFQDWLQPMYVLLERQSFLTAIDTWVLTPHYVRLVTLLLNTSKSQWEEVLMCGVFRNTSWLWRRFRQLPPGRVNGHVSAANTGMFLLYRCTPVLVIMETGECVDILVINHCRSLRWIVPRRT